MKVVTEILGAFAYAVFCGATVGVVVYVIGLVMQFFREEPRQ